jgi:hypothetical protein
MEVSDLCPKSALKRVAEGSKLLYKLDLAPLRDPGKGHLVSNRDRSEDAGCPIQPSWFQVPVAAGGRCADSAGYSLHGLVFSSREKPPISSSWPAAVAGH